MHFQQPGDAVEYGPDGVDRTRLLAGPPVGEVELLYRLRVFAERTIGRIAQTREVPWVRTGSRVWMLTGPGGGTWYLKRHRRAKVLSREMAAYRSWVPEPGPRAPRLVAAATEARAVVVTALPGRPLPSFVPTHGYLQYRNVLLDDDGEPLLFEFERFSRTNSGGLWGVMMETSTRVEEGAAALVGGRVPRAGQGVMRAVEAGSARGHH